MLTGGLLAYLAWRTGVTIDEPGHVVGARLYWEGADRLPPGDMPPLIKIVGGWVPWTMTLPLPADLGEPGDKRREWDVALVMMEHLPITRIREIFFYNRLPMIVFPLMTTCLVWWWARRLFSPLAAILAASLFALEPNALAHGPIFKNDHAATFAYLLFWCAIWRYWRVASYWTAALVAVATALCMLAKLSLLFVFGVAPVLIVLSGFRVRRWRGWRTIAIAGGVCTLAYLLVLAAAQFDVESLTTGDLRKLDASATMPRWFALASRAFTVIPVPAQMWAGTLSLMAGLGYEMPVYFLGRIWPHGNPWYFPVALLVKAPVSLIALALAAPIFLLRAAVRRQLDWTDLFWILPGPVYVFLASRVPLQLGIRLILPALPFAVLMCAYAIERLRSQRPGRVLIASALAVFAFESVRIYPNGIAFFNLAAGGPSAGFRYLADSNLDWGQGLGELERWMRANRAAPIRLSYFGADMMYRYFKDYEVRPIAPPWTDALAKGPKLIPEPGQFYAISPTLLPGQFFAPKYRDYYSAFRAMTPLARPGYSMFVYKVDAPRLSPR